MRRHIVLAAITLVALTVTRAAAAQAGVAGRWIFEFNRRVSNMNGELTESDPAKVRLTLEQRGDSVIGTWQQVSPAEDPMPKPRALRGVIANGKVRLVSEPSEGRVHDGGGEVRKVSVITTLEFTVSGDDLSGTRKAAVAGEEMGGEGLPFKAVRERQ
jgi:hypothetical protein